MILADSNIPMYLVGAPHPHKADAQRLPECCITERERLVTDAEVLQEILQRARTILLGSRRLSARDALHVGVMEEQGIQRILSFDAGFDGLPGIDRVR